MLFCATAEISERGTDYHHRTLDRRVIIVRAMRVRWRDSLRLFVLAVAPLVFGVALRQDAGGFHDPRGGHIDQVAIDMGPPGAAIA